MSRNSINFELSCTYINTAWPSCIQRHMCKLADNQCSGEEGHLYITSLCHGQRNTNMVVREAVPIITYNLLQKQYRMKFHQLQHHRLVIYINVHSQSAMHVTHQTYFSVHQCRTVVNKHINTSPNHSRQQLTYLSNGSIFMCNF